MKKAAYLFLLVIFIKTNVVAQTMYAALKQGLTVYSKPSEKSKVIGKMVYGEKVILAESTGEEEPVSINIDGFTGYWQKIKFNNKTGYVIDSYLLPVVPPQKGITTLKDYFNKISTISGKSYVKKPGEPSLNGGGGTTLSKSLYKNGMEVHEFVGYEYNSETYILPEFSVQQAFLLVRLLQTEPELIGERDPFPTESITTKLEDGTDKVLTVEKESWGDNKEVTKIKFETAEGASVEFSIYLIDYQAVIFRSEGV